MASIEVTTLVDTVDNGDGVTSLREAIASANSAAGSDIISFAPTLFSGGTAVLALSGTELSISDSITITGPGPKSLSIDAGQTSRVLDIPSGSFDVSLSGFTIKGGKTSGDNGIVDGRRQVEFVGGGIRFLSLGKLELTDMTITGNSTKGEASFGGGIAAFRGAVSLNDSVVTGNITNGVFAFGGGIGVIAGQLTINNSVVSENGTEGDNSFGGGLANLAGTVALVRSKVTGNHTSGENANGGGIGAYSGAISLTEATISNNMTRGNLSRGGGVFSQNGDLSVNSSTISGNGTSGGGAHGGGIGAGSGALTVSNSTVSGNSAVGPDANGGGVFSSFGSIEITTSTVTENRTVSPNTLGGGVHADTGQFLDLSTQSLTIRNSIATENAAPVNADFSNAELLDLPDLITQSLTIRNSIIAGNSAPLNADFTAPAKASTRLVVTHGLIGDNTGTTLAPSATADVSGNLVGSKTARIDPRLGPLRDNGGLTQTHALLLGSKALNAGNSSLGSVPAFDQRGAPFSRVEGSALDIGALEQNDAPEILDFGDAAARYPVTLASNGARHRISSLFLGQTVSPETDGKPTTIAGGDSDDDGVSLLTTMLSSASPTTASVVVVSSGPGKLDGWIDFNQDGDWLDAGEQVFASKSVATGSNIFSFPIAAASNIGNTFARFRLSTSGALGPLGRANDGEVEDYPLAIVGSSPSAAVSINVPVGTTTLSAGVDSIVVRQNSVDLFRGRIEDFGSLRFIGSSGNDSILVSSLANLSDRVLQFDGGLGEDRLAIMGGNQKLDLTQANISVTNIEVIDLSGTGEDRFVVSLEKVKTASATTDTLKVVAAAGDVIELGTGWKVETPKFIDGMLTHIITELATGGTARIELRNDRLLTNPLTPFDADRDGKILPLDALRIINELRRRGGGAFTLPSTDSEISKLYFDVNGDNRLTALDALRIINAIARVSRGGSAEGEVRSATVDFYQYNTTKDVLAKRPSVVTYEFSAVLSTQPRMSTSSLSLINRVNAIDELMRSLSRDATTGLDDSQIGLLSDSLGNAT